MHFDAIRYSDSSDELRCSVDAEMWRRIYSFRLRRRRCQVERQKFRFLTILSLLFPFAVAACFCCSSCPVTNAVGVFHNRALALLTTLFAGVVALFAPRAVPLVVVVGFFAGLNGAEALSINDVWLIVAGEKSSSNTNHLSSSLSSAASSSIGALPHYVYVPRSLDIAAKKRASSSPFVLQRMNISALVTDNYAKTIVESAQKNAGDVAALATFQMNIPETVRAQFVIERRDRNIFTHCLFVCLLIGICEWNVDYCWWQAVCWQSSAQRSGAADL